LNNSLLEFNIGSVTEGTKALGQVMVRVGPPEEDHQAVLEENLKHNAQTGFVVTNLFQDCYHSHALHLMVNASSYFTFLKRGVSHS
jgi:hypothetical protein